MTCQNLISFILNKIGTKKGNITEFRWGNNNSLTPNIPDGNGIYIMFEDGQKDNNNKRRIIRIGKAFRINKKGEKVGFKERLGNHFKGKIITNSVFRKHIALSLLNAFYLGKNI